MPPEPKRLTHRWSAADLVADFGFDSAATMVESVCVMIDAEILHEITVLAERMQRRRKRLRHYQKKAKKGQQRNTKERAQRRR